jgi:hypothetical protein
MVSVYVLTCHGIEHIVNEAGRQADSGGFQLQYGPVFFLPCGGAKVH